MYKCEYYCSVLIAQSVSSGGKAIQTVSETRAVGAALKCEALIKNKDAMVSTFHSEVYNAYVAKLQRQGEKGRAAVDIAEAHRTNLIDSEVHKLINEAWLVSEPTIKLARVGDSASPTMGIVLDAWLEAEARIDELPLATTAPLARTRKLKQIFLARKKAALSDLHYAAFALEPSYLGVNVFPMEDVMQGFNTVILRMSSAHPLKEEAATRAMKEFQIFRAKQGMFGRQSVDRMIDKMPSYQWFQQFGAGVPHLQYFAVRILAMQSVCSLVVQLLSGSTQSSGGSTARHAIALATRRPRSCSSCTSTLC